RHRGRCGADQPQHARGAVRRGPRRGDAPRSPGRPVRRQGRHPGRPRRRDDRRPDAGGRRMSTDTSPKAAFNPEDMTGRPEATIWQKLGSSNTLWVGVILVGLVVAFSVLHPGAFLTLF